MTVWPTFVASLRRFLENRKRCDEVATTLPNDMDAMLPQQHLALPGTDLFLSLSVKAQMGKTQITAPLVKLALLVVLGAASLSPLLLGQ